MYNFLALPRDHPESYHYYMFENFFKHIDIDPKNAHVLDGNAADLVKECEEFENEIQKAGGVELFVGGIFKVLIYLLYNQQFIIKLKLPGFFIG